MAATMRPAAGWARLPIEAMGAPGELLKSVEVTSEPGAVLPTEGGATAMALQEVSPAAEKVES